MPNLLAADSAAVTLPAALRPPLQLALARAATAIPAPTALPGGCLYEPKWDGFRLVVARTGEATTLWSRQGVDLTAAFPDLAHAATMQLPAGVVVDGEAVVWRAGALDFDALQRRLVTRRGAAMTRVAREVPASFAAFDVLAVAGRDVRGQPLRVRRALLEELAAEWSVPLNLSPASTDAEQAAQWFDTLAPLGIEGLVVKGLADPYQGGQRTWVKVKHRVTVEVVCGAVIGPLNQPGELVVGLPIDGRLRVTGRSAPLRPAVARSLGAQLQPPVGPHPWPATLEPSVLNQFNSRERQHPVALTLIEPVVVEVAADIARSGDSFRHVVHYLRLRPELTVADVQPPGRAG